MTLMHFEYDTDTMIQIDNYDFKLEKAKYSVLKLSKHFENFLRTLFSIYSFNKYILSFDNIKRIFEPLHSELISFFGKPTQH